MKAKILNFSLIITSLIGYLESGTNNKMFLFEVEIEVISKLFTAPSTIAHPMVIIPLLAQIILIFTLFQKSPGKVLTLIGLGGISLLLLIVLLTGLLSMNYKIIMSTIPFIITGILVILQQRKNKRIKSHS